MTTAKRHNIMGAIHAGFDTAIYAGIEHAAIKCSWWGWWLPDFIVKRMIQKRVDAYLRARVDEYAE